MTGPVIYTRRQFLARTAAAGAGLAAAGVLGACSGDDAAPPGSTAPATTPRPDAGAHDRIVAVAVHPAIGIARVGNSPDHFFIGPEVPGALPVAPDGFKDPDGAIARQAARFRIYGYDAAGEVVAELTAADADIAWTVSVANTKAAWYDFDTAMDIPVAGSTPRRNADVTGTDRDQLRVVSGEQTIRGAGAVPVALDQGRFQGQPVPLGELLTDEQGRLLFLPAEGRGYSPTNATLTTFSDNDGWVDDTCDGPVLATVTLGDRTLEAEPGWVVVTPPNYGPGLVAGLVTAYDSSRLGWDTGAAAVATAGVTPPGTVPGTTVGTAPGTTVPLADDPPVSYREAIEPIFGRIVDMQWVNAGFLGSNGWGSGADYLDPVLADRLADPSPANAAFRADIFGRFRNPDYAVEQPDADPQLYGDGVALPAQSAYQWLTVTPIQFRDLAAWAEGRFVDDRDDAEPPASLDELPAAEQPGALDRAGLDACLGGAYHPGIEVPWTLRVPSMWAGPLRLKVRSTTVDTTDYGDALTPEVTMAPGGPVDGSGPGDLTRWQGTPWQSDAGSCRSGYEPEISPVLPTFWPARIPNHVLRQADYEVVMDTSRPIEERRAAFERRYDWERFVAESNRTATLDNMMAGWGRLGMVTVQPGPDDGAFPRTMKVETLVGFTEEPTITYNAKDQATNPLVWDGEPVTGLPPGLTTGTTPGSTPGPTRR